MALLIIYHVYLPKTVYGCYHEKLSENLSFFGLFPCKMNMPLMQLFACFLTPSGGAISK